ncbi:nuclease SbcCD subunit C [Capnocytophaga sp. HP1101]
MKILSVSLHNIASIEGPFTLNLEAEPLKSVGLFAITGATGAGKSTILDAICLALYNDTPRLATTQSNVSITDSGVDVKANNVKNLLRKGAVSGYAKVVFRAVDGKTYEAEWQVSRAYNRLSGAIQNEKIQLTCLTDKQVFSENRKTLVLEKIKECVGLTFDEFTKSVILAQGDFTSFLKANDDKRSDILEKLTGTEIYTRISKQVYELNKQHKNELQLLEKQLENIVFLTEEERTALTEQLTADEERLKTLQASLTSLKEQQQWFDNQKFFTKQWEEAKANKKSAEEEKESQAERFAELAIIEQLQAVKGDILTQQREKEVLVSAERRFKEATTEKEQLTADKARVSDEKITAESDLATAKEAYESAKPAIAKAKELDVRLTEQQRALSLREQQHDAKRKSLQAKEAELGEVTEHIQKGEGYLQTEEQWLSAHPDEAQLYRNALWLSQLAMEQQQLNERLSENTQARQRLSLQLSELRAQHPVEALPSTDMEALAKRQKELMLALQVYQSDREVAKRMMQYEGQKAKGEGLLQEMQNVQSQTEKTIAELQTNKEVAQIACDTAERIYQKAQIENTKDVAFLREHLVEGEACPVCGSVHHPNAHKAVVEHLIDTVQQEFLVAKAQLETITKDFITKEAEGKELKKRIESQQLQNIEYADLWRQESERLSQSVYYSSYPSAKIEEYITDKIAETEHLLTEAESFFEVVKQLNSLTEEQNVLTKDAENEEQQRQKHTQQLQNLQLSDAWLRLWQTDIVQFQIDLNKATSDYQEHSVRVEKYKKRLAELSQERAELTSSAQALEQDFTELNESIAKEQEQWQTLRAEREGLLEGKQAEKEETAFEEQISELTVHLELSQQQYNAILLQIATNEKVLESLVVQQQQSQTHITEATHKIEEWLKGYEPAQIETIREKMQEWANRSHEWLQTERQALQLLNERIAQYHTIANEKQQALETLKAKRPLELTEDDTLQQLGVATAEEEALRNRVVTQKSRLLADEQQRTMAAELHKAKEEKEKLAHRWSSLNDLIGSSTGNAFRKYAQEYTLDMLLQYANVQMCYLNRRYTLQRIPNSLSLQVIDNDMGAEVRSVYSLSGGESFLVSLALALALSSLSSTKMNVETLFIDEGFGSLDSETLSVALDALESLQNQGKKVGVISHVQEMVERIAVKVVVQKEGNGKSKIVVNS